MGAPSMQAQQAVFKDYSIKNKLEDLPVKKEKIQEVVEDCVQKECECEELIGSIELTAGDKFYFNIVRPYVSQEIFWTCVFVGAVVVGLSILKKFGISIKVSKDGAK